MLQLLLSDVLQVAFFGFTLGSFRSALLVTQTATLNYLWKIANKAQNKTYKTTILMAFFPEQLGQTSTRKITILDFNEAQNDGVTVASPGPYSNHHLHLTSDR